MQPIASVQGALVSCVLHRYRPNCLSACLCQTDHMPNLATRPERQTGQLYAQFFFKYLVANRLNLGVLCFTRNRFDDELQRPSLYFSHVTSLTCRRFVSHCFLFERELRQRQEIRVCIKSADRGGNRTLRPEQGYTYERSRPKQDGIRRPRGSDGAAAEDQ